MASTVACDGSAKSERGLFRGIKNTFGSPRIDLFLRRTLGWTGTGPMAAAGRSGRDPWKSRLMSGGGTTTPL